MFKKRVKFTSLVFLVLLLFMSSVVSSFASDNSITTMVGDTEVTYQVINDNNAIMTENNERFLISESQSKNLTTVTIKNLETGSEDYFLRDDAKGTIYSSITGKTLLRTIPLRKVFILQIIQLQVMRDF